MRALDARIYPVGRKNLVWAPEWVTEAWAATGWCQNSSPTSSSLLAQSAFAFSGSTA